MTVDVVFKLKVIANINHHYREQNYTLSFVDCNLSASSINHNKTQEKNYQEAPGVKPKLNNIPTNSALWAKSIRKNNLQGNNSMHENKDSQELTG